MLLTFFSLGAGLVHSLKLQLYLWDLQAPGQKEQLS